MLPVELVTQVMEQIAKVTCLSVVSFPNCFQEKLNTGLWLVEY